LSDDVVSTLADLALGAPANDTVEIGGPEKFRLDELVRLVLGARDDPRKVTGDVHARYFGAELNDGSLVPGSKSQIAPTRFKTWLSCTFPSLTSDQHERQSSIQGQQA
jgi:uncharacterized protein YbjT (DUF2867 family)